MLNLGSWISQLCGIGRRLRRLQRPGVVSFKAIMNKIEKTSIRKAGNRETRTSTILYFGKFVPGSVAYVELVDA